VSAKSRPRRSLFVGEFIGEALKRGHPTDGTEGGRQAQARQTLAVWEMVAQRLLGKNLEDAKTHTAELIALYGKDWKCEEDGLRDLYRASVRDAIDEVAGVLVKYKKLTSEEALSRTETILAELDKRRDAQLKNRKG